MGLSSSRSSCSTSSGSRNGSNSSCSSQLIAVLLIANTAAVVEDANDIDMVIKQQLLLCLYCASVTILHCTSLAVLQRRCASVTILHCTSLAVLQWQYCTAPASLCFSDNIALHQPRCASVTLSLDVLQRQYCTAPASLLSPQFTLYCVVNVSWLNDCISSLLNLKFLVSCRQISAHILTDLCHLES